MTGMNENLHTHPLKRTEKSRTFQSGHTVCHGRHGAGVQRRLHESRAKWEEKTVFLSDLASASKEKRENGLTDQSENGGIFLLQLLASLVVPLGGESVFAAALGLNAN